MYNCFLGENMNLLVLGLQWGDEGKGKAIDFLAGNFDVVVRYQGGHNAGHTIYYKGKKVILHLLPSGIFSKGTMSVIGHGVVVNPIQLVKEIKNISLMGISTEKLVVSMNAPVILPFHQKLDIIFENSRYLKIGTTKRGIGPAYEDLVGRRAVFIRDLIDKDRFYKRVKPLNDYYSKLIRSYDGEEVSIDSYIDEYIEAGIFLKKHSKNTTYLLNELYMEGKSILFEGAQGVLLDVNQGTYPYVTSSNTCIGGVFTGTGLPHKAVGKVIGISKAYTTRVGEGPFPTELFKEESDFLREKGKEFGSTTGRPRRVGWLDLVALKYSVMINGKEFGSTTGRPRRVGWLDLVALKYSVMINGIDSVFVTKLDIFDEFDEIKVVTDYEINGEQNQIFDPSIDYLNKVKPVFKSFPGWKKSICNIKSFDDLPERTKDYIKFIENYIKIPVEYISVGTQREQTINR
jgi:adenylosuccinate synthase